MALTEKLTNIANAIRTKTNTSEPMTLDNMVVNINSIETEPKLQDKSIEITENGTISISADENYDGLGNVEVTTNISSGGEAPTVGFMPTKWDSTGYITEGNFYGASVPTHAFSSYNPTYTNLLTKNLAKVTLSDDTTIINTYAFMRAYALVDIIMPSVKELKDYAFQYCNVLNIKKLPDSVTSLAIGVFNGCKGLIQMSMNVPSISGSTSSNGTFANCTELKAVWIGSKIASQPGFYAFTSCSKMQKMYIDKPRATVEGWSYYANTFSASAFSTDVIVCNDDVDWKTREEFDAIDWENYQEETTPTLIEFTVDTITTNGGEVIDGGYYTEKGVWFSDSNYTTWKIPIIPGTPIYQQSNAGYFYYKNIADSSGTIVYNVPTGSAQSSYDVPIEIQIPDVETYAYLYTCWEKADLNNTEKPARIYYYTE